MIYRPIAEVGVYLPGPSRRLPAPILVAFQDRHLQNQTRTLNFGKADYAIDL